MIKDLLKSLGMILLVGSILVACSKEEDFNKKKKESNLTRREDIPTLRLDSISADTITALDTFKIYGSGL